MGGGVFSRSFRKKDDPNFAVRISLLIFVAREPPSLLTMLKSGVVLFLYPNDNQFLKQYNSPEDLAELLSQRGLAFDDKERVCRYYPQYRLL